MLFFDRVGQSDGPWHEVAKDPAGHVDYLLLSTDTSARAGSTPRPRRARTRDRVDRTDRYVLVSVPSGGRGTST